MLCVIFHFLYICFCTCLPAALYVRIQDDAQVMCMVFCEDAVQVVQCSLLTVTCLHLDDVQVPCMCSLWVVHDRCRVWRTGIVYVLVHLDFTISNLHFTPYTALCSLHIDTVQGAVYCSVSGDQDALIFCLPFILNGLLRLKLRTLPFKLSNYSLPQQKLPTCQHWKSKFQLNCLTSCK